MKLRFLGQTYFQFQQQIPTVSSENTACYRGQKYNPKVPTAISQPQSLESQMSVVIYIYRGVRYIVERRQFPTKPDRTLIRC